MLDLEFSRHTPEFLRHTLKLSGNAYVVGPYSPADADRDIFWMDGYFIHWPQPRQGK